jgi:hemolysin activation/secretion protein
VNKPIFLIASSIVLLNLSISSVYAQQVVPQDIPTQVSPGAILQTIQQPTQTAEPKKKPATGEPIIDDQRDQSDQSQPAPEKPIQINEIHVEGNTVLSDTQIKSIVSEHQGRMLTLSQMQTVAQQLTKTYRDKGYITTRAYIPPQRIEDGSLKIQVSEGNLGEVTLEEGDYFKDRAIFPRLDMERNDRFNLDDLKNSLRRINENPDVIARVKLTAGKEAGETDVNIILEDKRPIHLGVTYDNLGRRLIGNQRYGLIATHNNLLGFGDRTSNSLIWSRESFGLSHNYEVPVGKKGTKLGFNYSFSTLELGKEFKTLDIKGEAMLYSPYISQELFNSDRLRISADAAFDFQNLETTMRGDLFTRDRVRALRTGINLDEFDRWGRTFLRNEFAFGFNVFGATTGESALASRAGAGSKFFRYIGSLTRVQKLPLSTFGIFRATTQLSPDRLVSSQQMQVGGAFTVRGYEEGKLIGDSGLVISAELRAPCFIFPKTWKLPGTNYGLRDNIQVVGFTDFGASFVNKPTPGIKQDDYLMGAGTGLRVKLTRLLTGRVDFAFPILQQQNTEGFRVHFGLLSELF